MVAEGATGGLHIGVPASAFCLVDLRGRLPARRALSHEGRDPADLSAEIAAELGRFLAAAGPQRPLPGVGAALGGWIRPDEGVVVHHPVLRWRQKPLGAELSAVLGVPVRVDHHARAAARAEILFGRPEARLSLVHLFIGHGVDAAFGMEGTVHQGPGSAAGDVAHLPCPDRRRPARAGVPAASSGGLRPRAGHRCGAPRRCAGAVRPARPSTCWYTRPPPALRGPAGRCGSAPRAGGRAAALLLDVFNPAVMVVTEPSSILHEGYLEEIRGAATVLSHGCSDPERIVSPHAGSAVLPKAAATVLLSRVFRDPFGTL